MSVSRYRDRHLEWIPTFLAAGATASGSANDWFLNDGQFFRPGYLAGANSAEVRPLSLLYGLFAYNPSASIVHINYVITRATPNTSGSEGLSFDEIRAQFTVPANGGGLVLGPQKGSPLAHSDNVQNGRLVFCCTNTPPTADGTFQSVAVANFFRCTIFWA